jgi:hypothetical protein
MGGPRVVPLEVATGAYSRGVARDGGVRPTPMLFRPWVAALRAVPFLLITAAAFALASLASYASFAWRLLMAALGSLFLVPAAMAVLRSLVLVRPGAVQAGTSRRWLSVMSPGEVLVRPADSRRRWATLVVAKADLEQPIVTAPGPIWLGSHERHADGLNNLRQRIVAIAVGDPPPSSR